jgi:hypothetical protein
MSAKFGNQWTWFAEGLFGSVKVYGLVAYEANASD